MVVSERRGRLSITITDDTFQHVNPGMGAEAAETLAGMLRP